MTGKDIKDCRESRDKHLDRLIEMEPMAHLTLLAGALAGGLKGRAAYDQADTLLKLWSDRWIDGQARSE